MIVKRICATIILASCFLVCCPEFLTATEKQRLPNTKVIRSLPKNPRSPQLKISVSVYPDVILLGDPVYVICEFMNVDRLGINNIPVSYQRDHIDYRERFFSCDVVFPGENSVYIHYPEDYGFEFKIYRTPTPVSQLKPNESRLMYSHTYEFPPLEDWQHPLWKKLRDKIDDTGLDVGLQFTTRRMYPKNYDVNSNFKSPEVMDRKLKQKLTVKCRPTKEMELLDGWFAKCRNDHFPVVKSLCNNAEPSFKCPEFEKQSASTNFDDNFIKLGEYKHCEPYKFIRVGNRKPPMHLCPNTWEGWQKLEESFEPSTLRDEIHWTRICIQYCSTGDEKVLAELKTWLDKMNPIQRTVMVNNYFRYDENLPNSKKLYETIQSFKEKK